MNNMAANRQDDLRALFGEWVSFDLEERRIYSHDVGVLPKLIKPVVGSATADAVVQPEAESQLIGLVNWANQYKIHLVPRAKATSGYGGVLPVKGGISVSMNRMRKILEIDAQAMSVRVEPGVVWNDLERALEKAGLSLRTYPSSAPSSTVGGWLAQGGVGYGGYEYGCFLDNVISARVVLPSGEARVFQDRDLEMISEAEGTTGFITEIVVRVRHKQTQVVCAVQFDSATSLSAALNDLHKAQTPVWSVSFINPTMAHLNNQLPPRMEHGHAVVTEHRPRIPENNYIVLLSAPADRWVRVQEIVDNILSEHGGGRLPQSLAEHEWDARFNLMHIKRLGPSLLPAEVVVPLANIGAVLEEARTKIKQELALEGMVQLDFKKDGERSVTLIGFIPHDERTLGYGIAYGLSLTLIRIAKKYGGRPYATGFYFSSQANEILGTDRVRRLREFKQAVDPKRLMNPQKVIEGSLMGRLLGMILPFEPLVRGPANLFRSPLGEHIEGQGRRGIPDDVAWYAYTCAQCGYCVDSCDQYYGRGWESESPRGRWFFLMDYLEGRASLTQEWVDNFLACTTCELCNAKCPLELPIESMWMKLRGELIQQQDRPTFPPFEIMSASARSQLNVWGAYRKDRDAWLQDLPESMQDNLRTEHGVHFVDVSANTKHRDVGNLQPVNETKPEGKIAYFAGCTASYVEKDIAQATVQLLHAANVSFTYLGEQEACCGIPLLCAGRWDGFEETLRHNIQAMQAEGVTTVVTSCPACWLAWNTYYPQWALKLGIPFTIQARHYSELLAERIASGDLRFPQQVPRTVTWHDSCHMGRAGGIYEPPRQVLQAIPGIKLKEMEYSHENAHCCGSVVSLLESPDKAAVKVGKIRLDEAVDTGAEALISACPCCEVQFRVTANKVGIDLPIIDLAHIAAEGLGIKLPDPTENALRQWQTFDAMIKLLKPEPMAEFMASLLPQMIDAMPQPFQGVMKWTKASSPTLRNASMSLMKPMLPSLFPRLLPGMMPKLMPDMLLAMEQRVPMPDYMKEQMPELMPQVMQNLMPKMLPEVIPHFIPKLEAYMAQ
jgi:Fe-S oxidoreductase/FAD/FMN-containing dehydrogenase